MLPTDGAHCWRVFECTRRVTFCCWLRHSGILSPGRPECHRTFRGWEETLVGFSLAVVFNIAQTDKHSSVYARQIRLLLLGPWIVSSGGGALCGLCSARPKGLNARRFVLTGADAGFGLCSPSLNCNWPLVLFARCRPSGSALKQSMWFSTLSRKCVSSCGRRPDKSIAEDGTRLSLRF